MIRWLKIGLVGVVLLALLGLVLPAIMRARLISDRDACKNHLRMIGLDGVRHASAPGQELPLVPKNEYPPGTFLNPALKPDERASWYVYTLNVLDQGAPNTPPNTKKVNVRGLGGPLASFDAQSQWNNGKNADLARFKLSTAICPAQVPTFESGQWITSNYIAVGGLGPKTPTLDLLDAGPNAGMYRYDSPTPDKAIKDGQRQTAQFIETLRDLGPWLQGGPATLRGLDVQETPYLGKGRPFGGCHADGTFVSFADGSVQFVRDSINPAVFRSMWTIAGGVEAETFDAP